MAEEMQSPKSKKDTFLESHRSKHPELDMENEEDFYGSLSDDFGNYDNQISELESSNSKYKKDQDDFINAMSSNKDNARYVSGMMNGEDWLDTAIGIHGYDGLIEYLQSEEAREKYKEADAKHKAEIEKSEELDKEIVANADATDAEIQKAIEAGRFTQEEYETYLQKLYEIADGLELCVCKPEWIEMAMAAENHDSDVEKAREEGRIDGKNEGLEANIGSKKKSAAPQDAPSMPVGVGGRVAANNNKRGSSLADMLMK